MGEENIKFRFIAETHDSIINVLYYTLLIKKCTMPWEGTARSSLVERVYATIHPLAVRGVGLTKRSAGWTKKSSEILIDTVVNLEFLHRDYHWDAKGHVINTFGTVHETPELPEKIAYLKYFLEGDGGALIHLVKIISELGGIERVSFLSNRGWEKIMENMAREYLSYPSDLSLAQKYRLRKILGSESRKGTALGGYSIRTTPHRLNPRAEILVDLGILVSENEPKIRYESAKINGHDVTDRFKQLFGDIPSLEMALSKKGDFFRRAARLYGLDYPKVDIREDFPSISSEIVRVYEAVKIPKFRLASLDAVKDIVSLRMLSENKRICEWSDVDAALQRMKEQASKDIHYHVDDWGVISYVTINQGYIDRIVSSHD